MSFSEGWLRLREPYDRRARNAAVLDAVAAWAAQRSSIAVVDLACGLGSTLRAVSERLPKRQSWRLDRKSTRLNSSHMPVSRMPSSA